jgi:hypothetical protein
MLRDFMLSPKQVCEYSTEYVFYRCDDGDIEWR